jgi:VIT1/CCC1 family predicted Fe2+/Mn2+ transporter
LNPLEAAVPGTKRRVLDPTERVSEILFGLIMVLTFTGSLSVAEAGREEVRTMLVGAIGCNIAWGMVDAVMYLLTTLVERQRSITVAALVRSTEPAEARAAIAAELPPVVAAIMQPSDVDRLRLAIVALPDVSTPGHRAHVTWQDVRGAVETFLLVILCTFPVVIPFLVFSGNAVRALRVSNAVALTMLFLGGYSLGRYSGLRPWRLGLSMAVVGVVLVAITMALGG